MTDIAILEVAKVLISALKEDRSIQSLSKEELDLLERAINIGKDLLFKKEKLLMELTTLKKEARAVEVSKAYQKALSLMEKRDYQRRKNNG